MLDVTATRNELESKVDGLEREAKLVYDQVMCPHWGGELLGLPQTLYGYMMVCFSWIDLLSAYWAGGNTNQTPRMINFMDKYISPNREAYNVAVKCWRHVLMHTAEPRRLQESNTKVEYDWLLHWWRELPAEQHFAFQHVTPNRKILNLGLIYLIADIRSALQRYLDDVTADPALQHNFERYRATLSQQEFTTK